MDYKIEFDKTYIDGIRSERVVCVILEDEYTIHRPFVFRIVSFDCGDKIRWYYNYDEFWLQPNDESQSMDNLSIDTLVDTLVLDNKNYYWNHD